eukprot:CAMPEP_0205912712 /NCGR_PEP_ID=MMETSP1325-20131115/6037_1 /ASSEMBLY_ACC=CAM_ASM_000708 /TAXON_ID=236786 /ORGANISM="Florenciella sp., Strain RCC1007" /LENGTH=36 /DNA_ID= /DNA_START= /DNA_END= /DNA_ORIENTATION=
MDMSRSTSIERSCRKGCQVLTAKGEVAHARTALACA